jgi:methionyl-tRNA formyltransferase
MLPEDVWDMPPHGTINLHGSLLPQYRGAAPINWAVMNGEVETGVTTFKLKHEIDTGDILLQEKFSIGEDENAGEVHDRMKVIGAQLLLKTVRGIAEGNLSEQPQTSASSELKHAPKIFTETCTIDWNKTTTEIHNLIRGLSPFPGAITKLNGKILKIYKSEKVEATANHQPGEIATDNKKYLRFACADGYISVIEMQAEGKKRMPVEEYLRGNRIAEK